MTERNSLSATLLGLLALLFWSCTVALAHTVTRSLGIWTATAMVFTIAGALSLALTLLRPSQRGMLRGLSPRVLFGCGALFVTYMVSIYAALGLSSDQQAVEVGIVNYLWPSLIFIYSVLLLAHRARATLVFGTVLGFAGAVLAGAARATAEGTDLSWASLGARSGESFAPYLLAFLAANCWGLYSVLTRRWGGGGHAVPIFLLATAAVVWVVRAFAGEHSRWSWRAVGELLFLSTFSTALAYSFWDIAVRRGSIATLAAASYATPLMATAFACAYLRVVPSALLWLACALVVTGAVVCRFSVVEPGLEKHREPT
jgi:drug/metabolite transporter (DMT)-like permease